ncbi:hypothetical protein FHU36_006092 [Nonomuraea muscovyensis]|uniref:Uncharacterized protein n=1 Tax=Nonomuraea muscovyensis TaxID=1124761 RepID=A0A7X0EYV8_9ACTN|nr:hypothetical protein [Nonomuraea muscovyensis]MBB6349547.1 hypothetical protein [Nonomuraea muscovyensis]
MAAALLGVLAGCRMSTTVQSSAAPAPEKDTARQIQAALADCMKGRGFTYVPFVAPPLEFGDEQEKAHGGDHAAMKAERSKRGFGVFYHLVHPHQPKDVDDPGANPNWKIKRDLSPAQQEAYDKAEPSCQAEAITKVTGKVVKSEEDRFAQINRLIDQTVKRELDGDPELVGLASAMADCLSGKGHRMTSTKPTALHTWGWDLFTAQKNEIAKNDDIPDTGLPEGEYYEPSRLSPVEARRHLDREIKVALDDLECGKDFYAAYQPRFRQIERRISEQFGVMG